MNSSYYLNNQKLINIKVTPLRSHFLQTSFAQEVTQMENISVDQLHDRVGNLGPNDLILDVRSQEEFEEGHIKGAMNTNHIVGVTFCE